MNIFGVGLPEVTVILILALLIFGPKKLPELGKQLGKTLKSLKKASNEFQNEIDQVMNEDDKITFNLSERQNILNKMESEAILVHVAVAETIVYPYEALIRSLLKHLVDAATSEFLFILDFFKGK